MLLQKAVFIREIVEMLLEKALDMCFSEKGFLTQNIYTQITFLH